MNDLRDAFIAGSFIFGAGGIIFVTVAVAMDSTRLEFASIIPILACAIFIVLTIEASKSK